MGMENSQESTMNAEEEESSPSIQSSSYPNVLHKKVLGTLILTEEAFTFYPFSSASAPTSTSAIAIPSSENRNSHVPSSNGASAAAAAAAASSSGNKGTAVMKPSGGPSSRLWATVHKHQVSPASHPRHLLKILWVPPTGVDASSSSSSAPATTAVTFEFKSRLELERIRKDISHRLSVSRKIEAWNSNPNMTGKHERPHGFISRKRKLSHDGANHGQDGDGHSNLNSSPKSNPNPNSAVGMSTQNQESSSSLAMVSSSSSSSSSSFSSNSQSFTTLLPTERYVTCSSILASDKNIRSQHSFLTNTNLTCVEPVDANGDGNGRVNGRANMDDDHAPAVLEEKDFWSAHSTQVSHQSAKILGYVSQGIPSAMKSSLDIQLTSRNNSVSKPIQLGVEEMRQIFIMYPAVHDAYEEKVPLELSEEQFWRKYLESEYFHRDRGRIGISAKPVEVGGAMGGTFTQQQQQSQQQQAQQPQQPQQQQQQIQTQQSQQQESASGGKDVQEEESNKLAAKEREESARLGAASSNDMFSRKEMELNRKKEIVLKNKTDVRQGMGMEMSLSSSQVLGQKSSSKKLAVGQFDLLSTAQTERGSKLLLNSTDLHPYDDRGKKVIEKYNRHWAMVLNPNDATAGCDLKELAKKSVQYALQDDDDAKVNGGFGKEMRRLVGFASADDDHVDHVKGMGRRYRKDQDDNDEDESCDTEPILFEELNLRNTDVYSGNKKAVVKSANLEEEYKKDIVFAQFALDQVKSIVAPILDSKQNRSGNESMALLTSRVNNTFPDPKFGCDLLMALTKHMVLDSMTDKDTAKMTKSLPDEFRKKLTSYTRRSNELLRHFFALRHVIQEEKRAAQVATGRSVRSGNQSSQKLKRIVKGMEDVYREMEGVRKELPQTELGEKMRKMCLPIMDQLDWAFKLNRDSSGSGGGGFVTVND